MVIDWLFYVTYLQFLLSPLDGNTQMSRLYLSTASLARKQHNHKLAERLLQQHIRSLTKNPENGKLPMSDGVLPALINLHANSSGLSILDILKVS